MEYNQLTKNELIDIIKALQKEKSFDSRDVFISNISHDVRTLLNAIYGHAQILSNDTALNSKQKSNVDKILSASGHMIDLINDIISVSKNSKDNRLFLVKFNLKKFLDNIYTIFESSINKDNVKLYLEFGFDDDYIIQTDKNKLFYILLNLLGNAVKFTSKGHIKLTCKPSMNDTILFDVIDTGIGINKNIQKKIFEEHFKDKHDISGDGLGLNIAQNNIKLLGSQLNLESKVSKGSRFFFYLKNESKKKEFLSVKKDIFSQEEIDKLAAKEELLVLLAQKNEDENQILQTYFYERGISCKVFRSLESLFDFYKNNKADMIFINTSFGLKQCESYLKKQDLKKSIFVAITAKVLYEELKQINKLFNTYIISPYNFLDVDQTLILFSNKKFLYKKKDKQIKKEQIQIDDRIKKEILNSASLGHYEKLKESILKVKHPYTKNELENYLNDYDFETIIKRLNNVL